jgi:hypothetical protein
LTACGTTKQLARLDAAAAKIGEQRAIDNLPEWPPYCSEPMSGVVPKLGEAVWGSQARWEVVRENENKRLEWCANHYAEIQKSRRSGGKEGNDAT